jgi:pimeloyl-ACP methyl ester carboxylesterase
LTSKTGIFVFQEPVSETELMNVHFHRPDTWLTDGPVLIVLHGYKRNADTYLSDWKLQAESLNALLICPEFGKDGFPTPREYEVGRMRTPDRRAFLPREEWNWNVIERAFDAACQRFGATRNDYWLYGHSAGGQFVHRLALYCPEARASHIIAANAGAYSAIDDQRFPYGVGQNGPDADIRAFLSRRITVLLGHKDRKTKGGVLLRSPEAMIQGPHRLARGRFFFQSGKAASAKLKIPFNWRLVEAYDVGHSNRLLAPLAAKLFNE